jgi:hypothetical protein
MKNIEDQKRDETDYHHTNWASNLGERDTWRHFPKFQRLGNKISRLLGVGIEFS